MESMQPEPTLPEPTPPDPAPELEPTLPEPTPPDPAPELEPTLPEPTPPDPAPELEPTPPEPTPPDPAPELEPTLPELPDPAPLPTFEDGCTVTVLPATAPGCLPRLAIGIPMCTVKRFDSATRTYTVVPAGSGRALPGIPEWAVVAYVDKSTDAQTRNGKLSGLGAKLVQEARRAAGEAVAASQASESKTNAAAAASTAKAAVSTAKVEKRLAAERSRRVRAEAAAAKSQAAADALVRGDPFRVCSSGTAEHEAQLIQEALHSDLAGGAHATLLKLQSSITDNAARPTTRAVRELKRKELAEAARIVAAHIQDYPDTIRPAIEAYKAMDAEGRQRAHELHELGCTGHSLNLTTERSWDKSEPSTIRENMVRYRAANVIQRLYNCATMQLIKVVDKVGEYAKRVYSTRWHPKQKASKMTSEGSEWTGKKWDGKAWVCVEGSTGWKLTVPRAAPWTNRRKMRMIGKGYKTFDAQTGFSAKWQAGVGPGAMHLLPQNKRHTCVTRLLTWS